jgi:glycosidase
MIRLLIAAATLLFTLTHSARADAASESADFRERPASDEIIYFLLADRFENADPANDRGGLSGDRLHTGYDPTAKGYFHGGDLKGVTARLSYIQSLGATALWLAPVFVNKPVQGPPGDESAGYHGYWITDFTKVDAHLGTASDLHALIAAAHARGMKIYLDIVINHTADVIRYRECPGFTCAYRSRADFPDRASGYAYTPYLPKGEQHVKAPEWLNDTAYYHNRGNSTFEGESSTLGDFSGLDDIATENPRVVQGFIDIFGTWIDDYGIDGYRIDTAKHVNPEFWQAFVPAMRKRAAERGIPNFHIFGEAATSDIDPASLAVHTRVDKLPAMLDFAFSAAVHDTVAGHAGTDELARLFAADPLYEGGELAAMQLPTFIGNHDAGHFAYFVQKERPGARAPEVLQRLQLALAMLFTLRGVPTIYYGDEQGFVGRGGDQDARQDMFASQVASYNSQPLLGTSATTAVSNFDGTHPLYTSIAALAQLRQQHAALRHGRQIVRAAGPTPGLFAVSRLDAASGAEILIAFNTGTTPIDTHVVVERSSKLFTALHGKCAAASSAPGSYPIALAPLDYLICVSGIQP